ncbi:YhcN/YlaJ family sporulation lipoprotein [Heyndrickxia sp. NPDC080065]|uniref:YhcN/YlaJ family sporulation lipoprotein n=1 Tax=Heyndrickxia sp. NPDC080065 TaxID=3390568 RepID=UPI003CFF0D5A
MKIAKTFICVGVVSGLLMGCATTNKNLTTRNNVNPVRYNNDRTTNPQNVNYNPDLVTTPRTGPTTTPTTPAPGTTRTVNNKMRVADEAASRVARLKEVNRANVIVTNRNAYVAVMLNNRARNELTRTVENKIAREVRKADNRIDNVYVSTNPDFYDRTTDYVSQIRSGHPVSGLFNQFNQTVQRIFPNAR